MFEFEVNDTVIVEQQRALEAALTSNPRTEKVLRGIIRKFILEARQDFHRCHSLTFIVMPDKVTSIGNGVYAGCRSLTSIEIPVSVTSIGKGAFEGIGLHAVISDSETPQTLGDKVFDGCFMLNTIVVPAGTAGAYKVAEGWSDNADKIQEIDGSCGDGVNYSYDSTSKTLPFY